MTELLDHEHERQHKIVADAKARYDALPARDKRSRVRSKNVAQRAWWALTWHMRRSHGSALRGSAPFLGRTYEEVEDWHARLHELDTDDATE